MKKVKIEPKFPADETVNKVSIEHITPTLQQVNISVKSTRNDDIISFFLPDDFIKNTN